MLIKTPDSFFLYIESIILSISNSNMGVPTEKYVYFGNHESTLKNVNKKDVEKALQIKYYHKHYQRIEIKVI